MAARPQHASTFRAPFRGGFTLVEILVAMAVLALVLTLMLQVVESIMRSTSVQNRQMDSVASARRAIDMLNADLGAAVIARDATVRVGTTGDQQLEFLTRRRGPAPSTDHRFLAVSYSTNSEGELVRAYESIPHAETDFLKPVNRLENNSSVVAEGVLQWKVRLVPEGNEPLVSSPYTGPWVTDRYNGLAVPGGFQALVGAGPAFATDLPNRVRALDVWLAAVDEAGFEQLAGTGALATLQAALATAEPETWRAVIDSADVPPQLKSSTRVLQKTIPLP